MSKVQIVFLPIGDKQCGDAIAIRFGDLESEDPIKQAVVLIDGGYRDDWEKVVELVKKKFKVPGIDLVVSSHLDADHIGGLTGVLENVPVSHLWMHLPWDHSGDFLASRQEEFKNSTMTKWLQNSLQQSNDLALAAEAAGITPEEPFAGKQLITPFGTLTVLGPSKEYYEELLPQIVDKSAAKTQGKIDSFAHLNQMLTRGVQAVASIFESHHRETLTDGGETSPSNNSSTILLLELPDGKKYLFTGDAGMPALELAHTEYASLGHGPGEVKLVQVPHHGSRQNVGPTILNKFLGERTPEEGEERGVAYVSVGTVCDNHGHPKKVATNAFKRRGYPVYQTRGKGVKFGWPLDGYTATATPLPLFESVESDE